ncbi:HNH endonuclease signature motif containing protein [Tepidibacter mesophilus]|uniref:HNH endonuclease signature motif containing protein n=1 Tax=Tepidibacter mesophilus TaxID=655607 RepID=UPI001650D99A|nr:HNH endonuclease signature motif containing protein [Tepidibacter mesophilus]
MARGFGTFLTGVTKIAIKQHKKNQKNKPKIKDSTEVTDHNITLEEFNQKYKEFLDAAKKIDYKLYLQSEHWKYFRDRVLKNHKACTRCGIKGANLQLHHKSFGYGQKGRENFDSIEVVCKNCHQSKHNKVFN